MVPTVGGTMKHLRCCEVEGRGGGGAYRGVADGSEDIELSQAPQGVDGLQSSTEGLMEDVADASPPTAVENKKR